MKYLKKYNESHKHYKIDDLSSCLVDLTDMGFEPEDGLIQTGEVKRLALMQRKDKNVHHEQDLVMALKLVRRIQHDKIFGYFEGTFDKHNFNLPKIINPNHSKSMHRFEFMDSEKELLGVIKDSVNKLINIYLEDVTHGKYSVNQYETSYGTCIVVLLKFYK